MLWAMEMGVTSTQDVTGRQIPLVTEPVWDFGEREDHPTLEIPLPHSLGSCEARCNSDAELSLSSLEECRRDAAGRKRVEGLLLVGHENVPYRFVLTGDQGGNTADGVGDHGRPASWARITGKIRGLPEPQTSISFPEIWYPCLGKGGKEELCVFWGILRDFGILTNTLSHYS